MKCIVEKIITVDVDLSEIHRMRDLFDSGSDSDFLYLCGVDAEWLMGALKENSELHNILKESLDLLDKHGASHILFA